MSPSRNTKTGLLAAVASSDDEHRALNRISSAGSGNQRDNASPMSSPIKDQAVENSKVSSPKTDKHQPNAMSTPPTKAASLARHLEQLQVKSVDDGPGVLSSIVQLVAATEKPSSEGLKALPSPRPIAKNGPTISCESLVEDNGISGFWSRARASLPEVLSKQERPKPNFDDFRSVEELFPELPVPADSGPQAPPPQDVAPGQPEEQPEGYIAPPPSPADNTPRQPEEQPEGSTAPPASPANTSGRTNADFGEFFRIQRSKFGGLGAFAVRELKRGQTILVERPLLRTTHFRLMPDYHKLSDAAKKAYLSLHGGEDGDRFSRVERIKVLNSFTVPRGIAIFEIASRFNHACPSARNVQYVFDNQREVLSLTICQDVVPAGAELFISYGGSPAELYSTWGFRCACGGCTPLTDDDIRRLKYRELGIWVSNKEYDTSDW